MDKDSIKLTKGNLQQIKDGLKKKPAVDDRDMQINYAFNILKAIRRSALLTKEEKKRMDIAIEILAVEVSEMQVILDDTVKKRGKDAEEMLTQAGLKVAKDGTLMPKVTKKEIFDFHNNLMTISEEEYYGPRDSEKLWERERRYIETWLESKGMVVEK